MVNNEVTNDSSRLKIIYYVNDLVRQAEADGFDMHTLLPNILQYTVRQFGAQGGTIILSDRTNNIEHFYAIEGDRSYKEVKAFSDKVVQQGLGGWVMRNQLSALVTNTITDRRWLDNGNSPTSRTPWSAICAPLVTRERPIGVITITAAGESAFNQDDLELLSMIAGQSSISIENSRLYRDTQSRANELEALVSATSAVSSSLNIENVLQQVASNMANLLNVESCAIYYLNRTSRTAFRRALFRPSDWKVDPIPRQQFNIDEYPVTAKMLLKNQPTQLHFDDTLNGTGEHQYMLANGIKTMLLIPLVAQDRIIGFAELLDRRFSRDFRNRQIEVGQTLSNQAAVAIENARLYSETQRQLQSSNLLNESATLINSSLNMDETMQALLTQMNSFLKVEGMSIALNDVAKNELVFKTAEGSGSNALVGQRIPNDAGIMGWVIQNNRPIIVSDTATDPRFNNQIDSKTKQTTKSMICAPLIAQGNSIGTIQAINPTEKPFTTSDLQLLVNLANLASSAVVNSQQFQRTTEAEERYSRLFEDSIEPILLTDLHGNIVETNTPAQKMLGYDKDELIHLPIAKLHPDNEMMNFDQAELDDVSGEAARVFESEVFTKEGELINVEIYGKRVTFHNSEMLQWIYKNVSDEVELRQMRDDLTSMLVHDLQSPLSNIISGLEMIGLELPEDTSENVTQFLDIASHSSNNLQIMIRSLLDINRLEAGNEVSNKEMSSLLNLIANAKVSVQPTLERRQIGLVVNTPSDMPNLYIDADMIQRVLINLLDNALKYNPDFKDVTIDIVPTPDQGSLVISISDQGRGVPESYRKSIFDKFRRVKDKGGPKGIGLGLAFCRLAVEAHGGRIWVDEAVGGGARFNFTLPIVTEEEASDPKIPALPAAA